MQTFLPYENFTESAKCLDYRRLGKQRVEARQIYDILTGNAKSKAWTHHPAILMWSGYENALKHYHDAMITEWIRRGYKNNMPLLLMSDEQREKLPFCYLECYVKPHWLNEEFCSKHRATLLSKNYEYYKQFNWKEEPKYEYIWPTQKQGENDNASR